MRTRSFATLLFALALTALFGNFACSSGPTNGSSTANVIGATSGAAQASATLTSILQSASQAPLDSGTLSEAQASDPGDPDGGAVTSDSDGDAPGDDGGAASADAGPDDDGSYAASDGGPEGDATSASFDAWVPPSAKSDAGEAGVAQSFTSTPFPTALSAIDQVGPELVTVTGPTRTFHVFPIGTPNPDPTVASQTTQILVVYDDGVFLYDVQGSTAWLDNSNAAAAAAELKGAWQPGGAQSGVASQGLQGLRTLSLGTDLVVDWLTDLTDKLLERAVPAFEAATEATGDKMDSLLGDVAIPQSSTAAGTDARTALSAALSKESSAATVGATATTATTSAQALHLVGDSAFAEIGHDYVSSQSDQYWQRITSDLTQLATRPPLATQTALIREIVQDENLPYIADSAGLTLNAKLGDGDCGNASLTGMFSLSTGRVIAALAYFTEDGYDNSSFVQAFRQAGVVVTPTPWFKIAANFIQSVDSKLANGQMAWLYSGADEGAHATVIVKLEGQLYNINNQGWENELGVAPGDLQTLSEWLASWQADNKGSASFDYQALVTNMKVVGY
jgi:hypothetical protein